MWVFVGCALSAGVHDNAGRIKRTLLVENPSTYFQVPLSGMSEPEFLGELAPRSGCAILLDINNIYVSVLNPDSRHGGAESGSARKSRQRLRRQRQRGSRQGQ